MILNYETVDLGYIKDIINKTILDVMCLCNIINEKVDYINENSLRLFFQTLGKNDFETSSTILKNFCTEGKKVDVDDNLMIFIYSLKKLYLLSYMKDRNDFRSAVTKVCWLYNEQSKNFVTTYLYRDKTTTKGEEKDIIYYNDLTFIKDTKLILDKTKEITNECIKESLAKYYNIEEATKSFAEKFAKSKENEKK